MDRVCIRVSQHGASGLAFEAGVKGKNLTEMAVWTGLLNIQDGMSVEAICMCFHGLSLLIRVEMTAGVFIRLLPGHQSGDEYDLFKGISVAI